MRYNSSCLNPVTCGFRSSLTKTTLILRSTLMYPVYLSANVLLKAGVILMSWAMRLPYSSQKPRISHRPNHVHVSFKRWGEEDHLPNQGPQTTGHPPATVCVSPLSCHSRIQHPPHPISTWLELQAKLHRGSNIWGGNPAHKQCQRRNSPKHKFSVLIPDTYAGAAKAV